MCEFKMVEKRRKDVINPRTCVCGIGYDLKSETPKTYAIKCPECGEMVVVKFSDIDNSVSPMMVKLSCCEYRIGYEELIRLYKSTGRWVDGKEMFFRALYYPTLEDAYECGNYWKKA